MRAYRDHLTRDPVLQLKTVRFYLNAAAGLLAQVGHADLALLQQSEVDRYLRRKPGQRASLTRFLAYVPLAAGVQLALPRRKRRFDPKTRERVLLGEVRGLLDRLDQTRSIAEGRAVLAAALSRLYHVPLSMVLALRAPDVVAVGATVTLWPYGLALPLISPLASAFRRWTSAQGDYLFPGRNGLQPLSAETVRYHLSKAEIVAAFGPAAGGRRSASPSPDLSRC